MVGLKNVDGEGHFRLWPEPDSLQNYFDTMADANKSPWGAEVVMSEANNLGIVANEDGDLSMDPNLRLNDHVSVGENRGKLPCMKGWT